MAGRISDLERRIAKPLGPMRKNVKKEEVHLRLRSKSSHIELNKVSRDSSQ